MRSCVMLRSKYRLCVIDSGKDELFQLPTIRRDKFLGRYEITLRCLQDF